MKKLTVEQMETPEGGRFLGVEKKCTPCVMGYQACTHQLYIFWLPVNDSWTTDEYGCGVE